VAVLACHARAEAQQAVGSFERTLSVKGPVDLDVVTGSGRIDVRTGQTGRIQINGRITSGNWNPFGGNLSASERVHRLEASPPIEQSGNRVRIGRIDDEALRNNVSISYTIVVPADTTLVAKTGSGAHHIEGLHGAITASAGSGSIDAVDVRGAITVKTGSGSIEVSQSGGGPVEASSGSGSIHLSGVRGGLRASTSSGALRVQGEQTSDWHLSSSSGSVTIELAGKPAFALEAHSSSGRIDTDYPVTMSGAIGRHDVRGSVNGGGPLLHVQTSSGGIHIR
jgi:hypothetical protein